MDDDDGCLWVRRVNCRRCFLSGLGGAHALDDRCDDLAAVESKVTNVSYRNLHAGNFCHQQPDPVV
jgi:hypothetical protein